MVWCHAIVKINDGYAIDVYIRNSASMGQPHVDKTVKIRKYQALLCFGHPFPYW